MIPRLVNFHWSKHFFLHIKKKAIQAADVEPLFYWLHSLCTISVKTTECTVLCFLVVWWSLWMDGSVSVVQYWEQTWYSSVSFLLCVFFFNHSVLNAHSHSAGVLQDKCCLLMVLSPHFSSSCPFKQVYRVSMMACCGTRSWQRRSQVEADQGRYGCEWWRRSEFLGECISVFSSSLYSVFLVFRPVHSTSN